MTARSTLIALGLAVSLVWVTGCDDDSADNGDISSSTTDRRDAPADPTLCPPACIAITGQCASAQTEVDLEPDRQLLRACIRDCEAGAFEDAELECLAEAACVDVDQCFADDDS